MHTPFVLLPLLWPLTHASTLASEVVYEWRSLDFDFDSEAEKQRCLGNGSFVPANNAIAGIKVYNDELGAIEANQLGNCSSLQYVQSMEVVGTEAEMWVIDAGRVDIFESHSLDLCPPKIVVIDIKTGYIKSRYQFPQDEDIVQVVSRWSNFLNDLVVDPERRFAYITNSNQTSLVVYDDYNRDSWAFTHDSMANSLSHFKIGNEVVNTTTGIDGIALSPDWSTVFYCPLAGDNLYSIQTSVLRDKTAKTSDFNRVYNNVGIKYGTTDGMVMSSEKLYYGILDTSTVMRWNILKDMEAQRASYNNVVLKKRGLFRQNTSSLHWPDTFAIDSHGYLWFTTNKLNEFLSGRVSTSGSGPANFRIWRVFINETSYLGAYYSPASSNYRQSPLQLAVLSFLFLAL